MRFSKIFYLSWMLALVPLAQAQDRVSADQRVDGRELGKSIAEDALSDFADSPVTTHTDGEGNARVGMIPMDVEQCFEPLDDQGNYILDGNGQRTTECNIVTIYFDPTNVNPEDGMMPAGSARGSLSPEDLQEAFNESTGSDGKYLDARGDLGRDVLSGYGECGPDVHEDDRSPDCDSAASVSYRIFEGGASNRLPNLATQIPVWFGNTESVYGEFVDKFAEDYDMCDTGSVSYSSSGQRMSYTTEERSCYELNTWEGQCEGTQEIEMKLFSLDTFHDDTFWVDSKGIRRDTLGHARILPAFSDDANFHPKIEYSFSGSGTNIRREAVLEHDFVLRQRLVGTRAELVKTYCGGGNEVDWLTQGSGYDQTRFAGYTETTDLLQWNENLEYGQRVEACDDDTQTATTEPADLPEDNWEWEVLGTGFGVERFLTPYSEHGSTAYIDQYITEPEITTSRSRSCRLNMFATGYDLTCNFQWDAGTVIADDNDVEWYNESSTRYSSETTDCLWARPSDSLCQHGGTMYEAASDAAQFPALTNEHQDILKQAAADGIEAPLYSGVCEYSYDTVTQQENNEEDIVLSKQSDRRHATSNEFTCVTTPPPASVCETALSDNDLFNQWGELSESMIEAEMFEGYCGMEWSVRSEIIDPMGNVVETHDAPAQLYGNNEFTCRADGVPSCNLAKDFQDNAVIWPENPFVEQGYRAQPVDSNAGLPFTEYRQILRVGQPSAWSTPNSTNRFDGVYNSRQAEQSVAVRMDNPEAIERVYLQFVVHDDIAAVRIGDEVVWASDPLPMVDTMDAPGKWLGSLGGCSGGSGIPQGADTGGGDNQLGGGTYINPTTGDADRKCSSCSITRVDRYSDLGDVHLEDLRAPKGGEWDRFLDYELKRTYRKSSNKRCTTQRRTREDGSSYSFTHCTCNATKTSSSTVTPIPIYRSWGDEGHHSNNMILNIDVTRYFRDAKVGETVQVQYLGGRGLNSGGFAQLAFDYNPDIAITEHVWGPDHCVKGAVDIGTGWATGDVQCVRDHNKSGYDHCIQVPVRTHDGQPAGFEATVCQNDLMSSVHQGMPSSTIVAMAPGIEWNCARFEADVEYTFARGNADEDHEAEFLGVQCDALEADDQCERITRPGADANCLEGSRDPVTGLCQISRVDYECKFNPIPVPTSVEMTLACNDAVLCEDGWCQDSLASEVSSIDDFARASFMLAVAESGTNSMDCADPGDINTCSLFAGSTESCARRMTNIRPCKPGDELTRPECSDDNTRNWESFNEPGTGNVIFDAGNDCCDQRLDGAEDDVHALTQWIRDSLDAKAKAEAYLRIEPAMEFHNFDGFEYLSDQSEADEPEFFYADMDAYLVAYESSMMGRTDPADDTQIDSDRASTGQKVNDALESVFGEDYGATIMGLAQPGVEYAAGQAVEYAATSLLGETLVGSLAGPFGTALAIRSGVEFVVGLLTACDDGDRQLWMDRRMGTCARVGDGECKGKVPFTNFCNRIEQTYCCYESVLARLVQEAARGNRLGVRQFDDPGIPDFDFDPVYRGWRGLTVNAFPVYEEQQATDENGNPLYHPETGDAVMTEVQVGTEVREDVGWLCHEPLTMENLSELDWDKVKMNEYIDYLYRTGQVPVDEFGNPVFGLELTGKESRLQFDGDEDRIDAAQRALQRLDVGTDTRDIRQSMDDNFELDQRPASRPWYQDYDAVLCEYDQDGLAPNDRFSCTHQWAPSQCDNNGYLAHGVCAYVDDWALECSPANLSVTLSDRCQEFRTTYCGMDRYGPHNVESCGIMGDVELMAEVASCESAGFWDFISNQCLVTVANQVCDHSYFSGHRICSPDTKGPVVERAALCLVDPTNFLCYEFKTSVACDWPENQGHPTCTLKHWDGNDTAEQCEFLTESGEHYRDRNSCVDWASSRCGDPDNYAHPMCVEVATQMDQCDSRDISVTTSSACQERQVLYCDHERFADNELCGTLGNAQLVEAYRSCESATFNVFVSNECQALRADICDHPNFTNSNLCNRTTKGPAKTRADACDSSDLSVLTSASCREFNQSNACDWGGWKGSHQACENKIASTIVEECRVDHNMNTETLGNGARWNRGNSVAHDGLRLFGFSGENLGRIECAPSRTYSHSMNRKGFVLDSSPSQGRHYTRARQADLDTAYDGGTTLLDNGLYMHQRIVSRSRGSTRRRSNCVRGWRKYRCVTSWTVETHVFDHDGNVVNTHRSNQSNRGSSSRCRRSRPSCNLSNDHPYPSWITWPNYD